MNAIAKITDVNATVEEWRPALMQAMSPDVDKDKFISAVITALTLNPEIARTCTPDSIRNACIKAAYDGLRPDGKEGALVAYNNKVKRDGKEVWETQATWSPMVYGVRKKAKEHDGILITANVVHEKDKFHRIAGDEERIDHEPAPLGTDPGQIIGAYAIYRKGDEILHREVISARDIAAIRSVSKAPNSPAWSKFFAEMAKKCVVRRGVKSVPMSDRTMTVITRDDDLYDFNQAIDHEPPAVLTRLEQHRERQIAHQSAEGFSMAHVGRETEAARQRTEQSAAAIPAAGSGSGDGNAPNSVPAHPADAADLEDGAKNEVDAPSSEPRSQAEQGSELSARDLEWLTLVAKMLWGPATPGGDIDVVENQVTAIRNEFTPKEIGDEARNIALRIKGHCIAVCQKKQDPKDTKKLVAALARCEPGAF